VTARPGLLADPTGAPGVPVLRTLRIVRRSLALLLLVGVAALSAGGAVSGCTRGARARPSLTVLAAASLTEAFADVAARYDGADLRLSFGGSQALAAQVEQGVPADVVATADEPTMARLRADGLVDAPQPLAANRLVIVVPRGNPRGIAAASDLARPGLTVVLAAPRVPAGRYAALALARAGVRVAPRSLEESVRGVTTKVRLGEADAGIAYATDVTADPAHLAAVPLPRAPLARYLVATTRASRQPARARDLVAFLTSAAGQRLLAARGFAAPVPGPLAR
jgi:molybdate transport system substrate-binding protein